LSVAIRLATPLDGEKLWALAEEFLASQMEFGAPDQRKALALALKHGIDSGGAVVVAEQNGELVGFVAWTAHPGAADGEAVGFGTYVKPDHRKHGFSERMRDFAKRHLRHQGISFVTGAVRDNNIPGLASARTSGGRIVGYIVEWKL